MNSFLKEMKDKDNYRYTENGGVTHKHTDSKVLDMFAFCGAYRSRSDADVINLFKEAFREDRDLAVKCLFYARDILEGQGERRFFRAAYHWLAKSYPKVAKKNMQYIPTYGRFDDLYCLVGTPLENDMFKHIKHLVAQSIEDLEKLENENKVTESTLNAYTCFKWLKSENCSSTESKKLGNKTRKALGMTHEQYRKLLSWGRKKVNVLETLMSSNQWDKIEFDKIPSKAGLIYRDAFARRDLIAEKYKKFAETKETKVNADALYPYDVAHQAFNADNLDLENPTRLMIQKYWDNLKDFYCGRQENGIAVVDTSGSMSGRPLEVAVSLGAYVADKAKGPFANHFITFSRQPELIEFVGVDIVDKLNRSRRASWGMNTDIEAVFNLLLETAQSNNVKQEDMPQRIYIISDMEFDNCVVNNNAERPRLSYDYYWHECYNSIEQINSDLEKIRDEWRRCGYTLPSIIFWNVDARQDAIPAIGEGFSYVSGFSPSILETILSGKDGYDLMIEKLVDSGRYAAVGA